MAKAIFLDRDGTINVDNRFIAAVENWVFCDGAIEGLKKLQDAGYKLIVITNQGGIGTGAYTQEGMESVHNHMHSELAKAGITLDGLAYCPHAPEENCACRKPNAGMLEQVAELIADVDMGASWMIGDKEADIGFGKNAGVKTALIPSAYWEKETLKATPDMFVESLLDFATKITES